MWLWVIGRKWKHQKVVKIKFIKFYILVKIFEGVKKLCFQSMYIKLSNGKSRFSIICFRKKGMFVLKNPSGAPLRGVLTCASLSLRDKLSKTWCKMSNGSRKCIFLCTISIKNTCRFFWFWLSVLHVIIQNF